MSLNPYQLKQVARLEAQGAGAVQSALARLEAELAAIGGPVVNRAAETKERLWAVGRLEEQIKIHKIALSAHRWEVKPQPKPQQQDEPALPGWLSAEARQQARREMEEFGIKSPEEWVKRNSLRNSLYEALPDLPENQ